MLAKYTHHPSDGCSPVLRLPLATPLSLLHHNRCTAARGFQCEGCQPVLQARVKQQKQNCRSTSDTPLTLCRWQWSSTRQPCPCHFWDGAPWSQRSKYKASTIISRSGEDRWASCPSAQEVIRDPLLAVCTSCIVSLHQHTPLVRMVDEPTSKNTLRYA